MRKLLFLFLLIANSTFADTTGNGCKINSEYVYTQYLGMAQPYGPEVPAIRYYNSNGPKVPIYWGYGHNTNRGYKCGYINVYGANSYWDADLQQNVPIPAEAEMTDLGQQCAIAPSLNVAPVATDTYVYYSYDKPNKCSNPPQNLPIDDYTWLIVIGTAGIGVYYLNKKVPNLAGSFYEDPLKTI